MEKRIGLLPNNVMLKEVNTSIYKHEFIREKIRLSIILRHLYVKIEHVGSTSIPGIVAKPIIDIAIGVKNFEHFELIKRILTKHGYFFLNDCGEDGRYIFIRKKNEFITHHIHIEKYGELCWNNHVEFRKCLIESAELRNKYVNLKKSLAERYADDRKKYTNGKSEFIQEVLTDYRISKDK